MARTAIRTVRLNLDVSNRMLILFGSIKNTHRQLGLEGMLPYQTVYEAFHGLPIRPEHKDTIEDAWNRWQLYYLRPEVPVSDLLQITPETRTTYPIWLPKRNGKLRSHA
jgi:hypothetical protein